jgi:O-antigen/teichoic acid export membrane protein
MNKSFLTNSFSGVAQFLLSSILSFAAISFFIHRLGLEKYGIFAILSLIGNLSIYVNLGLNLTIIKYLSEQGKCFESNYDIITSILLILGVIIPLTLIGFLFRETILINILKIPPSYYSDVKNFYVFLLISNIIVFLSQIAMAVIDSQQKIYISNIGQIIYNLVYWGSIIIIIKIGFSFSVMGLCIFLASFIWFIIAFVFARIIWGKIIIKGYRTNFRRIFKKQLKYTTKIYLSNMIGFFYEPLTKILISNFLGLNAVSYFDIALRIKGVVWSIFVKIYYPIFPLISSITDFARIRQIIHKTEQYACFYLTPIVVIILFSTRPLIAIWLGKDIDIIAFGVCVISISFIIGSIVLPNYQFLISKNYASKTIILQLANVITNLIIFFLTYKYFGYYSAILSFSIALFSSFILNLYYQKKYLNSLIFDSLKQINKLLFLFIICFCIGYISNIFLRSDYLKIFLLPVLIILTGLFLIKKWGYLKMNFNIA